MYNPKDFVPDYSAIGQVGEIGGNLISSIPGLKMQETQYKQSQEDRQKAIEAATQDGEAMGEAWKIAKRTIEAEAAPLLKAGIMSPEELKTNLTRIRMPTRADEKNPGQYIDGMSEVIGGIMKDIEGRLKQLNLNTTAQGLAGQGGGQPAPQGATPGQPAPTPPGQPTPGQAVLAGQPPVQPQTSQATQQAPGLPGQPTPQGVAAQPQVSPAQPQTQTEQAPTQVLAGQKQPGTADIMGGFGGTQFTAKDVQGTPSYESARLREEQAKATQTQAETKRQFNTNAAIKRKLANQSVGANEQNEILKKYNALLKTSSQESRTENTLNDDKRMLVSMKSKIGKETLGGDELSFLNENGVDSKTAAAGGQELLNLVTDMIKDLDRDITAQRKRSNAIEKSLNEFEEDPTAQLSDLLKTGRTITNQEPTRFQQFDDEYSYRVKR